MGNEPECAEIVLEQPLDPALRNELPAKLEHEPGIVSAYYAGETRLVVCYEVEYFTRLTLLDMVRGLGARAELGEE
ncbi:MAG: hypothetical protein GWO16_03125 [Gammaproteobacteria bacterium]|nr:hypothetical protein [Gammaproteobacteria bacterium]NIR97105.1 hypothetical protein [Gammaproteobacteria bacterium]NIT62808.1 hypothetical protein [Gammaproteobacteria bacterium]NIV19773.1 hypothetical protein [Gammaproteobacteria bacterium]NIX11217.1 hypothetical protein [Gammaproteobacteria bacterium]